MVVLLMSAALCAGCGRAQRFPPALPIIPSQQAPEVKEFKPAAVPANYGWIDAYYELSQRARLDIPLRFIAEDSDPKEWEKLKLYWNESCPPAGVRIAGLGLSPLEATVAFATQIALESIKIKVPRGLPDPTLLIPAANPPTFGKWVLGKKLFFDASLLQITPAITRSCADCHDPDHGFTLSAPTPINGKRNVPSLLNSVYNRHQFWDGRVDVLEQVLVRRLDDERETGKDVPLEASPGYTHVWPGLVRRMDGATAYNRAFRAVFGTDATADNIAKALATFMRTLLSGNSVLDQAVHSQRKRGASSLEPRDFEPFLSEKALKQMLTTLPAKEAAKALTRGHELFHGSARCHQCHSPPLFTDQGFHNMGIAESADFPIEGQEQGHFAVVPFGLKDRRLIGAFKTPSLRDVSRTAPYMHDGSIATLADVLKYFNEGLAWHPHIDSELLLDNSKVRHLNLGAADLSALELYLRALRGDGG